MLDNRRGQMVGEDAAGKPPFVYSLEYMIADVSGQKRESGSAAATITKDGFELACRGRAPLRIGWREIASFSQGDFRLSVRLKDKSTLELAKLGRMHDRFVTEVLAAYRPLQEKDLLMNEKLIDTFEDVRFSISDDCHGLQQAGTLYLQETGIIVVSDEGAIKRFPYAFMREIKDEGWSFDISTSFGSCLEIGHLARRTERFRDALGAAISELEKRALEYILALGGVSALEARSLVRLFLDGRMVSRRDLASWPKLWENLLASLAPAGLRETTAFFMGHAGDSMRICIKRALFGAKEAYLACFFPIMAKDGSRRVVMEASSTGSKGSATYVFAVPKDEDVEAFLDRLNYCLYMINFRREPIYMSDEALDASGREHYREARALPELRWLRDRFALRIAHDAHWATRVMAELF